MRVVPRVFIPDTLQPRASLGLKQVVRLAITLSLKKNEELPLHGHELKADAGIGEVEVPICLDILPKDGYIRDNEDVVVNVLVPAEYADRVCARVCATIPEPVQENLWEAFNEVIAEPEKDSFIWRFIASAFNKIGGRK